MTSGFRRERGGHGDMPDFGWLTQEAIGATVPTLAPLYEGLPWVLEGARVIKISFETGLDFVRSVLPVTLSRPTTAFGQLVIYDIPASPVGPFRVAAQTVGCRYLTYGRSY